jgi:hypothetical protein
MTDLYDIIYRMTFGDAVHTTVLALDRHVQPDDHGTIGHLTFRPESRDLVQTLSMATNALLHAMEAWLAYSQKRDSNGQGSCTWTGGKKLCIRCNDCSFAQLAEVPACLEKEQPDWLRALTPQHVNARGEHPDDLVLANRRSSSRGCRILISRRLGTALRKF